MFESKKPEAVTQTLNDVDAARYVNMSVSFLRKSRMTGDIPNRTPGPAFIKLGRAVRYMKADLDGWIAANRHEGSVK